MKRLRQLNGYQRVALIIVLLALAVGGYVGFTRRTHSQVISEPFGQLGFTWLKPNLRNALMIAPDRPHAPSEVGMHREGQRPIQRIREFTVDTNSDRLRMRELGPKKAGTTRIAAVGDSVTFGWGLPESESWVRLLEGILRDRGHDVEVLNAGLPAAQMPSIVGWCTAELKRLEVDRVIVTRRVPHNGAGGAQGYRDAIRACAQPLAVAPLVLLPPVSRFDIHGSRVYKEEEASMRAQLAPLGWTATDLTDAFRAAQGDHGVSLQLRERTAMLVDLDTKQTLLEAPIGDREELPQAIGDYFDEHPSIAEALMYDGGHPDTAGSKVMAELIADLIEPTL